RAYSAGYGVFSAKPLSNDRAFALAADLRTSEAFTVLHSVYQSSWTILTLDETPQHLAFYIPHTARGEDRSGPSLRIPCTIVCT
ncbi:hypothetical protein ACC712_38180, partial [Rhizobium ruizarguesonis]